MSTGGDDRRADAPELLDLIPVGVITFDPAGAVDMLNPAAAGLLIPLVDEGSLDNVFSAFKDLCPDLQQKVAEFQPAAGTILDQHRIDVRVGRQHMALALSVSRIHAGSYMAILKDNTRLTEILAYTFAAANLLISVDTEGTIVWAGGAFQACLGMRPQDAIGKPIRTLFAPRDRDTIASAMMVMGTRGRLAPLLLRLADAGETQCVVSGLALEGAGKRFMMTIGPAPEAEIAPEQGLRQSNDFRDEAERWMRNGQPGVLGLLDIKSWQTTTKDLDHAQLGSLKREIGRLGDQTGAGDVIVGEIGEGHFGVLGRVSTDLARLGEALGDLVGSFTNGRKPAVGQTKVELGQGELPMNRAVQALRMVLSRFGAKGTEAVSTGLAGGLAGMIEQAGQHKRALAAIISGSGFDLVFQPIVGLQDRKIHHYEALLRLKPNLRNPATGTQDFVTLVETVGLASELDFAVLLGARETSLHTKASIAINISGHSIRNPHSYGA